MTTNPLKQSFPSLLIVAVLLYVVLSLYLPLWDRPVPLLITNLGPEVSIIIHDLSAHTSETAGKYLLIHPDGSAQLESSLTQQPTTRSSLLQLVSADWQAIEALRLDWCRTTPTFANVRDDQPHYSVSVRCVDTRMILKDIPTAQAPSAVVQLLEHIAHQQNYR
jgi:hypothetical protein